jgi:putative membrane protein
VSDDEPDYRFTLANERTFLAWIRTSLALLAAAVAVVQLVPDFGPKPLRLAAGLIFAGLSLTLAVNSHRRWRQVDRAIRSGQPLPRTWMPAVTAAALTLTITIAIILMLVY